jgi:hypothetical protein
LAQEYSVSWDFDIQDVDILNFGEVGFQVGDLRGAAVFMPREIKKALIRDRES